MAEANNPPLLFDDDDDADLFKPDSSESTQNSTKNVVNTGQQDHKNSMAERSAEVDHGDIFADVEEIALDDPTSDSPRIQNDPVVTDKPNNLLPPAATKIQEEKKAVVTPALKLAAEQPIKPAVTMSNDQKGGAKASTKSSEFEDVDHEDDTGEYSIDIVVSEPRKVGDGMNAYIAYSITTKTIMSQFRKRETTVLRRFSDFLGLHSKLVEKHLPKGFFIPPPPEKSVIGMTKVKMSKEDSGSTEFVEKRRAALERFLKQVVKHRVLRVDVDFIEFLEKDGDLPKASNTSALSGAGVMKLFSRVGDSLGKMTFKMDETDEWFEAQSKEVDDLQDTLRKLHFGVENLVQYRKELSQNTGALSKSMAMLGSCEENESLSRALSKLTEVEEKLERLHSEQSDKDYFAFAEIVKDYVSLLDAVKESFHERVKVYKGLKDAEANLNRKLEAKVKLEFSKRNDKIPQAEHEIKEAQQRVKQSEKDFESISGLIRKEMVNFEKQRLTDFKATLIAYLEYLTNSQQQIIKYWEGFLPEAKAIV